MNVAFFMNGCLFDVDSYVSYTLTSSFSFFMHTN